MIPFSLDRRELHELNMLRARAFMVGQLALECVPLWTDYGVRKNLEMVLMLARDAGHQSLAKKLTRVIETPHDIMRLRLMWLTISGHSDQIAETLSVVQIRWEGVAVSFTHHEMLTFLPLACHLDMLHREFIRQQQKLSNLSVDG